MATVEKRNKIKEVLKSFSNEQLEETLSFIEQIKENDEKRKDYIEDLLKKEQNLFERLSGNEIKLSGRAQSRPY